MRDRFVRGALALAIVVPVLAAAQQPAAPMGPHREGTWELSVGVGASAPLTNRSRIRSPGSSGLPADGTSTG